MDDGDELTILIFICIGWGVLILAAVLSILTLNFADKYQQAIFIGELIALAIMGIGILKMRADLSW